MHILAISIYLHQIISLTTASPATSIYQALLEKLQINLNDDIAHDILKQVSFEQAIDMGATEQELDFIAMTNPPVELSALLQYPQSIYALERIENVACGVGKGEGMIGIDDIPYDNPPWVVMHPASLRYLFKHDFSTTCQSLRHEQDFFINLDRTDSSHLDPFAVISLYGLFGQLELIKLVWENAPDIVLQSHNQLVLLAAMNNQLETLKYLMEQIPSIYIDRRALIYAADNAHFDIVEYLVNTHISKVDVDGVLDAAVFVSLEMVEFLHYHIIDPAIATTDAMDRAVETEQMDIVIFLQENRLEGRSPRALLIAALDGNIEIVIYLMEHPVQDDDIMRAIHRANDRGHDDIVQYLQTFLDSVQLDLFNKTVFPQAQYLDLYDAYLPIHFR